MQCSNIPHTPSSPSSRAGSRGSVVSPVWLVAEPVPRASPGPWLCPPTVKCGACLREHRAWPPAGKAGPPAPAEGTQREGVAPSWVHLAPPNHSPLTSLTRPAIFSLRMCSGVYLQVVFTHEIIPSLGAGQLAGHLCQGLGTWSCPEGGSPPQPCLSGTLNCPRGQPPG